LAWGLLALLIAIVYGLPVAMIALASVAGQWNGALPSHLTFDNFAATLSGDPLGQLEVSVVTGIAASLAALILGSWAALALRHLPTVPKRILDLLFFIPSAVPSVSVGLGLLVAFSQPPLLLNGTTLIVMLAHFILISAFTYGNVSAGLSRIAPEYEQMAASLGARPAYRLWHVLLPLMRPYLLAAFSLSFALSMGELGATVMVYPPGWVTLPVGIFALTDRGDVFQGAALTMILTATTLAVLLALSKVPNKAAAR
jgi:2-aminoethylphosphonate transport system permease protein